MYVAYAECMTFTLDLVWLVDISASTRASVDRLILRFQGMFYFWSAQSACIQLQLGLGVKNFLIK